jgi:hypothetical protein
MSTRRKISVGATSAALLLCGAIAAMAYLMSIGTGAGNLAVGTLGSPSPVSASHSTGSATVTWTIVPSPSGTSSDVTYTVHRDGGSGFVSANNTCAGSLPRTTVTCNDQPGTTGDYVYRVTVHYRTVWTSSGISSSVHVVTDTAPALTTLQMIDTNVNGKIDRVVATFDEALAPSTATASWTLTAVPSGGSLSSVSVTGAAATLTLAEGTDPADTSVGSFTVALAASPTGIRDAAGNQSSFSATAPGDVAKPVRTAMLMKDIDASGRVDQVVVTFSETLATYTAANAPWTLAAVPSGGSLASVAVSGSTATLTLNEGAGSANTAVGSFTVALAANANGIRDAASNQASFVAAPPADGAAPRRCAGGCGATMAMQDINGNGTVDQVVATFSETLAPYTAGNTPWTLANVPSGRSLASVTVSSATVTLGLTATPATLDTAVGSFTVALAADAGGIRDTAGNLTSFAAAAPADQAAPVRTSLVMKDVNANGKIDQVVATYTENVICTCSGTAGWSLANIPSAGTFTSVAASTNQITITITEGSGAANTAVGTFTVAYAAGAGRVTDAAPNQAVTIAASPPTDAANPIATSLTISNVGSLAGKAQENDTIAIVFSEQLKTSSICSGSTWALDTTPHDIDGNNEVTATITDNGAASGNDMLTVSVISSICPTFRFGSIDLGSAGFVTADMTFKDTGSSSTDLHWIPSTRTIQMELGTATGGGTVGTVTGSVNATYTPDAGILDSAGNAITGTVSKNAVQF